MRIREANIEDINDIKKLYWELDTDAVFYQPSLFVRAERPDDFLIDIITGEKSDILLIEIDNNIIGFSLLQEKETPDISCLQKKKFVYILDFVISEAYRSSGYGSLLMESSKDWGKKRGLDFLRLSVFEENLKRDRVL
ncbi:GNAT family N-acetyltransferase [Paenibacillus sp. NFR01]|uniref:GNAT family N-acetyltransferase n=1 Tax=Paenibacillus sp. NFR01 TaxID=1566279 RepID=UPI0008AC94B6|nr:GNAT family N-acetyltransferase [Paenibacillus sp. NFR01]SES88530.1 Acetyltransferase (GNAT) family protein [Paenibacillus sp. NFR01]